jgi:hypothetical protein
MHLQVAILSDISDGDGRTANKAIMADQRPSDRDYPLGWPGQPTVTKSQVKLWARYLRTHFVTTEALHLRRPLGKWTGDSNLDWRYTQTPTDLLLDTTLRLQATSVRLSQRSTIFSVWRPVSRITTFPTPATATSQYPLSAMSRCAMVKATPPLPTPISFQAHLLLQPTGTRAAAVAF